jgi:iron complex transport system permease protein
MAVPHLARWIFKTSDHRILFPSTLLLGMITALACDLIARLPGLDLVLPLNAVTALLGAPVVLIIILRNNKFKVSF